MDGQLLTQAQRSRSRFWSDDSIRAWCYVYDDKVFLDVELDVDDPAYTDYKHWQKCMHSFEDVLRAKGVSRMYCWASSLPSFKFAKFYGFHSTLIVVDNHIELMYKDIH